MDAQHVKIRATKSLCGITRKIDRAPIRPRIPIHPRSRVRTHKKILNRNDRCAGWLNVALVSSGCNWITSSTTTQSERHHRLATSTTPRPRARALECVLVSRTLVSLVTGLNIIINYIAHEPTTCDRTSMLAIALAAALERQLAAWWSRQMKKCTCSFMCSSCQSTDNTVNKLFNVSDYMILYPNFTWKYLFKHSFELHIQTIIIKYWFEISFLLVHLLVTVCDILLHVSFIYKICNLCM